MAIPVVEGLTLIQGPIRRDRLQGTAFALPPGFPTDKYAARWEQKGNAVEEAKQPEYLASVGAQAEGWQVYKVLKNPKEALPKNVSKEEKAAYEEKYKGWVPQWEHVERTLRGGTVVLMFRSLELQKALNIVYANESRVRTGGEIEGDHRTDDPGILTNRDLQRHFKNDSENEENTGYLKPQPIAKPTEAATLHV